MKTRLLIGCSLFIAGFANAQSVENSISFPLMPPSIDAASWVLMDATTGQVLTEANENEHRNPASLTKLMTGYVVDQAVESHQISFSDIVTVKRDAWAAGNPIFKGSSLMFLKPGDKLSVRKLSRGMIIDSGNDACVALADYVAGNQKNFVVLMNHYVKKLGLTNTHFETVHGLDAPGQFSTALDMANLSRDIIHGKPEFYKLYSGKQLTWNGITQQNRNGLLWDKTLHVDGLKTGHTATAGFNLIASSVDGNQRLIAVVMGAKSSLGREEQARKLLVWGENNYTTLQLFHGGKALTHERVWYGNPQQVNAGVKKDIFLSVPKNDVKEITAHYVFDQKNLEAPIKADQQIGTVQVYDKDKKLASYPLIALQQVKEGGLFTRISDYISMKI